MTNQTQQRLPRNFGCIRYLGEGRRNPYAVHAPRALVGSSCEGAVKGNGRGRAICYVPNWETGFHVLLLMHNGMYLNGNGNQMLQVDGASFISKTRAIAYAREIMTQNAGGRKRRDETTDESKSKTIREVFNQFYEYKYGKRAVRKLAESTVRGKMILPPHGKEFFTRHGKQFFTLYGKDFFTSSGKHFFSSDGKQNFTLSARLSCLW